MLYFFLTFYALIILDYKWVQYDRKTFDRSKAYKVGVSFEGHEIYLGRGIVCGDLVPANVDHDNNTAIVTYHYQTFTITEFEVRLVFSLFLLLFIEK